MKLSREEKEVLISVYVANRREKEKDYIKGNSLFHAKLTRLYNAKKIPRK